MKLVISDSGRDWRGTERITLELWTGLRARGHEVVVFCRPDSPIADHLPAGDTVQVLSGNDVSPLTHWRCFHALRRHHPQLVITQKDKDVRLTGVSARLLRIPVLVRHTVDRPLKGRRRDRFYYGRVASHHVANTNATRATLLQSAPWLCKRDIPVIYNGIDVQRFACAEPLQLDLPHDAITIGFAGQFELRKGIRDFAQAWRTIACRLPNAYALIAGQGAREQEFRSELGDAPRVMFLGFRDDMPAFMRALDVFVLPSHFEGFGLVLAEAMAAGAACVAYQTSNIPELVTDGKDGLLVAERDPAALAQAVITLASDFDLRQRIGTNAAAHACREFTVQRMVAEYEALAQQIIAQRPQ